MTKRQINIIDSIPKIQLSRLILKPENVTWFRKTDWEGL